MLRPTAALLSLALAAPALAGAPPYIDDRSSPESVIRSLYNAIDRHEYLRAWSYFDKSGVAPYKTFRDGYAKTQAVSIRIGTVESEGAAGSIHSTVPVALRATATDGEVTIYTGCYRLTQIEPAIQDAPPFRPITIDGGTLARSPRPFATAMGHCD